MSKILAQGMITLTQLYEGAQVILTPSAVLIPCDSEEAPKPNAYVNAFTNVRAFLGTMDITSKITLGTLEYSDSTVKASKTGTKVSITTITTRTGYVDIPVSVIIDGETIDLGKHRFSFVKQIDGQTGQTGAPGAPGFSYTLNIKGGTRGVAYAANGTNPEPKTSSQFSVELLKNGVKVANPASISWTCGGNLSGASSAATFTPTIKSTYNSESSFVKVSVKEFAASLAVEETIPIICTKHADGLDWINEWNDKYVQVGTEKIITPKIFAGTKNSSNELTGVAIGRDVLGGNTNKVIGIVGYKENTPVFSLDQDANFFVSSSGSAGDIKNGTNNAKGIYFDGSNLYVSGKVKISGGSTIGESNTLVEDVINNSNLGAQANNKLDDLSIGGRNLLLNTSKDFKSVTFKGWDYYFPYTTNIKEGDAFSASIYLKPTVHNTRVMIEFRDDNNNYSQYLSDGAITVGNEGYVSVSATCPKGMTKVRMSIRHFANVTTDNTVQYKEAKFEKGNKPTDWTPAPEDVQADIDKKANSSDVYKKTETYTKTETDSAIEVAKDEINLGVSSTYETKTNVESKISTAKTEAINTASTDATNKVNSAKNELNNIINNIEVGGRNLLINCAKYTSSSPLNTQSASKDGYKQHPSICTPIELEVGTYVIQAETNGTWSPTHNTNGVDSSKKYCSLWLISTSNGNNIHQFIDMTRSVATVPISKKGVYYLRTNTYSDGTNNVSVNFWNIKLEKGNKKTGYSPAIEDVQANIDKKANSTDVYNKSEVYTKTETNSQINIAKDQINLGVSNTYETKANVETKVSSTLNSAKSYADTKKNEAISSASTDATNKVNSAKNELNTKIDGIQIGGRNLLLNSDNGYLNDLNVYNNTNVVCSNVNGWRRIIFTNQLNNEIVHDKWVTPMQLGDYTFSIMCRTDATSISSNISVYTNTSGHRTVTASVENLGNGLYRIVSSFSISNLDRIRVVDLQNFVTVGATYVEFRYPMLEVGNKASAWSQAPEDIQGSIDAKASKVDVYTKSETYTKAQTDSAINIAKDSINLGVSQTYETKSNVETKISSAKTELNKAITDISIGGRNLATGTNKGRYGWEWVFQSGSATLSDVVENGINCCKMVRSSSEITGWNYIRYSHIGRHHYLPNKKYTASFEVKSSVATKFGLNLMTGSATLSLLKTSTPIHNTVETPNVWTKMVFALETRDELPTETGQIFYLNYMDSSPNVSYTFRNLKIEEGVKPTAWTPSPEDVQGLIDSKANSTDVYNKTETYTKSETDSKINIAKDSINLGVSQTYETKSNVETKVNSAKNELNTKIDNIQVGGRNLLTGTKDFTGWGIHGTATLNETYNGTTVYKNSYIGGSGGYKDLVKYNSITPKPNTEYTLSFWAKGTGYIRSFFFSNVVKSGIGSQGQKTSASDGNIPTKLSNDWERYWITWTTTDSVEGIKSIIPCRLDGSADITAYICGVKLEIGNKATDYSEAPEDINVLIDKKANSTDVYTKSEVYTKSQTDSAINVAKDNINLSVSNTYETKANVETKVNNAVTGLKVGGNNLLRNSNFTYGMANWSIHDMNSGGTAKSVTVSGSGGGWIPEGKKALVIRGTNTTGRYGVISSSMKLTPNTKYTISGYCAGHRVNKIQVNVRDLQNGSGNIHSININPVSGGATLDRWYRFETTFTTTANTDFALNLYSISFADNGYVWFCDVQVQEGTKATAWTPCSEDIDSSINSKANSSDVYKKTETYTKSETDSKINVSKEAIELGVKNTYETKTNVETKISSANTSTLNSAKSYADTKKNEAISSASADATNKVNSAKTELNNTINNISIGGRNLALGTSNNFSTAYTSFGGGTNICPSLANVLTDGLKVGDVVTVRLVYKYDNIVPASGQTAQCWIQGSGDVTQWNSGSFHGSIRITLNGSGQYTFLYSFTINADHLKNSKWVVNIRHDYVQSGSVQWKLFKVERGNKPTDWCRAVEDIYTKSEVYTKTETNSQISATTSAITSRVSSLESTTSTLNGTVTNHENRLKTAENKITDSAIINTVSSTIQSAKNDAINSANSNTANQLKNYATTSSLTQTTNSITAKFESSGGYNLLKNSKAKNGTNYWSNNGGGLRVSNDATFGTCFYTTTPQGLKYSEAVKLKNNTHYVYEAYIYSRQKITGTGTAPLHFWCGTTPTTTGNSQLSILDFRQDVPNVNIWTKCYVHFITASSGDVYFTPFIYLNGSTSFDLWVTELSLSESAVESKWSPHPDEVYSGSTIIDATGVTVNNGALRVKNKSGTTVLSGDSNGNLVFTGTAKSQAGAMWASLDAGGLSLQDSQKSEQTLRIGTSYFSSNRDMNGATVAMPQYSDFVRFSHISKPDLTSGWSSTDAQYHFMDFWSSRQTIGSTVYEKGINVHSPIYMNDSIKFKYSRDSQYTNDIASVSWNEVNGLLGVYGDNGAVLGYQSGSTLSARIIATEFTHPGTGDYIRSWGNWNLSASTIHNGTFAGSHVNSYSNPVTRTYTSTYCIESETKQVRVNFENIQITDGKAIINIPNKYIGINNGYIVSSIVKKGKGDVWVAKETENRFTLEATDDIKVNVEIIIKLEESASYELKTADDTQLCIDMSTGQPTSN